MNALYLSLTVIGLSAQGILQKIYNRKTNGRGAMIFSSVSVLSACLFFLTSSGFKLNFAPEILPYALGFALAYGTTTVAGFFAIRTGSLSLTSLITSYSLIIPTLFGLIFLDESATIFFFFGLALLLVSLFLINSRGEQAKISLEWVICVSLAFLGNGICSAVQNLQQRIFLGEYKNEFMIIALCAVSLTVFICSLITERVEVGASLKRGWYLMALCGISNGLVNLFVMILSTRMNASLMFPVISAGGIILTFCVSRFIYKERLTKKQNFALVFGVAAVILMNL